MLSDIKGRAREGNTWMSERWRIGRGVPGYAVMRCTTIGIFTNTNDDRENVISVLVAFEWTPHDSSFAI